MASWLKLSVRTRLVLLFIAINAVLLLLLMWVAWNQTQSITAHLDTQIDGLAQVATQTLRQVGDKAIEDAVVALDARARAEIERLSTDTANRIADFLYGRDSDILYAATLEPSATAYRNFIERRRRRLIVHGAWHLNPSGKGWEPEVSTPAESTEIPAHDSPDSTTDFHYRPPLPLKMENQPLYLEMSFIGLDGREKVKITSSPRVTPALQDITRRENTYAKAETYFPELAKLKPGEIYVSEVIGSYVGTKIIGKFTPEAAQKLGVPFEPEKSAYAGRENPVGKRFHGIVRWGTPVVRNGQIVGWVTLALDHDHLMFFTEHLVPSSERYRDIGDAYDGNYASLWDNKGSNIAHPRHASIAGYDEQGNPEIPWMGDALYESFLKSGKPWHEYAQTASALAEQLKEYKVTEKLAAQGKTALDCRWLSRLPQCTGIYKLTKDGGSVSFLAQWSGLWKLNAAAAIPYYTGQYSPQATGNRRGFGLVAISAHVDEFHRPANESRAQLNGLIQTAGDEIERRNNRVNSILDESMSQAASGLSLATIVLVATVIAAAIWMVSFLSKKIGWLSDGLNRYRLGEKNFRFQYEYKDEITSLAATFNEMAEALNRNVASLEEEIENRTRAEEELRDTHMRTEMLVEERTRELSEANRQLSEEVYIRREAEEKAQYLAGHDPLTGLANRMLFNEQLQKAIGLSERSRQYGALLFLDLDHFKYINDTLGHTVGDALLTQVGEVLRERVRKTDTAARLGGDEFAVIMTGIEDPERASVLAQDILDRLRTPVLVSGYEMTIQASIGITAFQGKQDGLEPEDIIKHADMAMYASKAAGGTRYQFFESSLQEKLVAAALIEKNLRLALDNRQFVPYFQPLYHTVEQNVLYLEVLARWNHPAEGILLPAAFIDAAGRCGLVTEIDTQIAHMACSIAREWINEGLFSGRISFNISPKYLEQTEFITYIRNLLYAYQLPSRHMAIEISEYTLLQNSPQTIATLKALREIGVEVIIDRVVIERSALGNLFQYPVDAIKVDRQFTSKIGDIKANAQIAAIAAVAHAMNLRLIAEGVENETEWDYFQTLRCEIIQGYKHASPMDIDDTRKYLLLHQPKKESNGI